MRKLFLVMALAAASTMAGTSYASAQEQKQEVKKEVNQEVAAVMEPTISGMAMDSTMQGMSKR